MGQADALREMSVEGGGEEKERKMAEEQEGRDGVARKEGEAGEGWEAEKEVMGVPTVLLWVKDLTVSL